MTTSSKETILKLAIAVIDEGGESAIRVNDLAAEAGVTPPTLYRHFGSRDGLVCEAQTERYIRSIRETIQDAFKVLPFCQSKREVAETITGLMQEYFSEAGIQRRKDRINVFGSLHGRPDLRDAVAKMQRESFAMIEKILQPLQDRNLLVPELDLQVFGAWFTGMMLSRSIIELGDNPVDAEQWNKLVVHAALTALLGDNYKQEIASET